MAGVPLAIELGGAREFALVVGDDLRLQGLAPEAKHEWQDVDTGKTWNQTDIDPRPAAGARCERRGVTRCLTFLLRQ